MSTPRNDKQFSTIHWQDNGNNHLKEIDEDTDPLTDGSKALCKQSKMQLKESFALSPYKSGSD